jgi:hypothetical protein
MPGKYKTLDETLKEAAGKAPKWLGKSNKEAEEWMALEGDKSTRLPSANEEGLEHDPIAYLGAVGLGNIGAALGTAGIGKAVGDVKDKPLDGKSWANAAQDLKEFGLTDPTGGVGKAGIGKYGKVSRVGEDIFDEGKYWVNPKGKVEEVPWDMNHQDVAMGKGFKDNQDAMLKGHTRVSGTNAQIGINASSQAMNAAARLAAKKAMAERQPFVFLDIITPKGVRKTIFDPKELSAVGYDVNQAKAIDDTLDPLDEYLRNNK